MNVNEPDKLGLPRVFGHVEVSCKGGILNKSNIPQLADMIWRAVSEKQPGWSFFHVKANIGDHKQMV